MENSSPNDWYPDESEDDSYERESQFKAPIPENCAIKILRLEESTIEFEPKNCKLQLTNLYSENSDIQINKWCEL